MDEKREKFREAAKKEVESRGTKALVNEIKSLCEDRLDAVTADGSVLHLVFEVLEERLSKTK